MAYKLEVNHPDYPKDWEFDMDGVLVKNGGSATLTEEDEYSVFSRADGRTIKDVFGHKDVPEYIKLSGSKTSDLQDTGIGLVGTEPEPAPEPEAPAPEGGDN